ncbi:hypothetical protein VM1G_11049 [Cytospora mali]|nr:hypothetical protein VM1G_11049 [Valsa mali]
MNVLLLKNYPSATPADHATIKSFTDNIQRSVPSARIDICCIASGETIPDVAKYDLVVLSGGRVNLLEDVKPQWALDVLDMVRRVAGQGSKTKLLGICWGHQAIHYALGGKLAWLESPRIGVQRIDLTSEGQQFFQRDELMLHKVHVRYVSETAPGFTLLAKENEITLSSSKTILTSQGHPEMTNEISELLTKGNDGTYTRQGDIHSKSVVMHDISAQHDGSEAWKHIMRWAEG